MAFRGGMGTHFVSGTHLSVRAKGHPASVDASIDLVANGDRVWAGVAKVGAGDRELLHRAGIREKGSGLR
jgi:hypothetical protein